MASKLVISREESGSFMRGAAMNHQYGAQVFFRVDPVKAQELLPPPLTLTEDAMGYFYAVNIREPSFGPWYMEAGIGLMAKYKEYGGLYFTGLMLTGPGAIMGMCSGRETCGLPKKLGDRIHVERLGDEGRIFVERDGVRLVDIDMKMGEYGSDLLNKMEFAQEGCSPDNPKVGDGGCLLFRYMAATGNTPAKHMSLNYYDSPTSFTQWDKAAANMTLKNGPNDFWGDIPVTEVLGGGWMVSDNWMRSQKPIAEFSDEEGADILRYLFSGRYDQCTLKKEHQIYEA